MAPVPQMEQSPVPDHQQLYIPPPSIPDKFDNVMFHSGRPFLLKGDRQIPVSSVDPAAQGQDLAIPGEQRGGFSQT